jgi:hypothetical protein
MTDEAAPERLGCGKHQSFTRDCRGCTRRFRQRRHLLHCEVHGQTCWECDACTRRVTERVPILDRLEVMWHQADEERAKEERRRRVRTLLKSAAAAILICLGFWVPIIASSGAARISVPLPLLTAYTVALALFAKLLLSDCGFAGVCADCQKNLKDRWLSFFLGLVFGAFYITAGALLAMAAVLVLVNAVWPSLGLHLPRF